MKQKDYQDKRKEVLEFILRSEAFFRENKFKGANHDTKSLYAYGEHYKLYESLRLTGDVNFPISQKHWPKKYKQLHYNKELTWPDWTTYSYVTDVITGLMSEHNLLFGYAFINNKPVKTAFFTIYHPFSFDMSHSGVIDPIAVMTGKQPECYVGISLPKKDLLTSKKEKQHPLTMHVKRLMAEAYAKQLRRIQIEEARFLIRKHTNY